MKKLLLATIIISGLAVGQKKKTASVQPVQKINCYLPDGEKCPSDKVRKNMFETSKFFEEKGRTWFTWIKGESNLKGFVVLKSLTKKPLYVLFQDKIEHTPEDVKEMISKSDYSFYFGSSNSGLKMDIDKLIKEKSLTDTFLLDTLGSPTKTYESHFNGKNVSVMDYSYMRIKIYLVNSIAIGYDEY